MIFIVIVAAIFLGDFLLKRHVNDTRLQGSNQEILGGRVILRNCHNEGAVLGTAKEYSKALKGLSAFLLSGIAWDFLKILFREGRNLQKLAYALLLGGGLNNYYERCTKGYVTDYVSIISGNKKLSRLVFNLSDVFLLFGSVLYLFSQLMPGRKKTRKVRIGKRL